MGYRRHTFQGHSGYIVHPSNTTNGHNLISIGHTASITPWNDPQLHQHSSSEEYYILRQGVLKFLVSDIFISLQPNEILMVKPEIPHAIIGGDGEIEHFGIRTPSLNDKQVLGQLPAVTEVNYENPRVLAGEWGFRIPLTAPQHQNCWLIGAGSAKYKSEHMVLAYLKYPTEESANAGIGTRHRLHLHQRSWEYYTVLRGVKTLQIGSDLVTVEAGNILEIPPNVKHTLHHRTAPFEGFTLRVPIELDDKVEF